MSDKLDDNAPLAGIHDDGSAPRPDNDSDTLLGRLVDPHSYENSEVGPNESRGLVNSMLEPLLGDEGQEPRNPDAQDTTENSEG